MDATEREYAILSALREAAPAHVSGEMLAVQLGVSRVAVSKRIAALRELGYAIEASAGVGYRLVGVPDLALPCEVAPLLASTLWTRLEGGGPTGSTNDDAKRLAAAGTPEGTVVLASAQSSGRGRLGREWTSPPGGVYLSVILRPPVAWPDFAAIGLVTAVAAARALESFGVQVLVKWPNDLYCANGRKLGGILVEAGGEPQLVEWAVIGCGINVRSIGLGPEGACHLDEATDRWVPLPVAAAAVLDSLADAYLEYRRDGFVRLREEYLARSFLTGREVTVRKPTGEPVVTGRVAGVDDSGRLVVEGPDGAVMLTAGEVTLRDDAGGGA